MVRKRRRGGLRSRLCLEGVPAISGRESSWKLWQQERLDLSNNSTFLARNERKNVFKIKKEEFLERERTKKKKNKNKKQLSLEFFHLGQIIWRGCGRHFPIYGGSAPPAGSVSTLPQL